MLDNPENIAKLATAAIAALSFILASLKAGYIIYYSDKWWDKNRPKREIDETKISLFAVSLLVL